MANDGNHITAPVNTDDVSVVLGVNSHDVRTLCRSNKINPYSLIRPRYSPYPNLGPENLKTMGEFGPIPAGGVSWHYYQHNWGYFVPAVGVPANITEIQDKPWVKNGPSTDSYDCLTQFDGYLHNAEPSLPVQVQAVPGKKITITINVPKKQQNILSSNGIGNNGGIVDIIEVLGSVRLGCTLYEGSQSKGAYIMKDPIDTDNPLTESAYIDTGFTAQGNTTYKVIPWATNGNIVNNQITTGSLFYSLKYAPNYEGAIIITTPTVTVYMSVPSGGVTHTSASTTIVVNIYNQFEIAQTVSSFRIYYTYSGADGIIKKEITHNEIGAQTIPAKSYVTVTITEKNSEFNNFFNNLMVAEVRAKWGSKDISSGTFLGPQTGSGGVEITPFQ